MFNVFFFPVMNSAWRHRDQTSEQALHRFAEFSKKVLTKTPSCEVLAESLKRLYCKPAWFFGLGHQHLYTLIRNPAQRSMSILTEGQCENGPYTVWGWRDVLASSRLTAFLSIHWKLQLRILSMELWDVHQSFLWILCKYSSQINLDLLGIVLNGKVNPALFSYLFSL